MAIYGGIDVGGTGALSLIEGKRVKVYDFEDNDALNALIEIGDRVLINEAFVMVERQQAFHKQGAVSGFKLGVNYGLWRGRLEALSIPFAMVSAKQWQNYFFVDMPKRIADKGTKKMSLYKARSMYPEAALR